MSTHIKKDDIKKDKALKALSGVAHLTDVDGVKYIFLKDAISVSGYSYAYFYNLLRKDSYFKTKSGYTQLVKLEDCISLMQNGKTRGRHKHES
jgi:hypothetical protein